MKPGSLRRPRIKGTLIAVPDMLLSQWCRELAQHAPSLTVSVFSPSKRRSLLRENKAAPSTAWSVAQCDVVLITFEVLADEMGMAENQSPITQVQWWRMVTDEAQTIKMGGSIMSSRIHKVNHWAVTGTPCSKQISDIATSMYFLQAEPFCEEKPDTAPWEGMIQGIARKEAPARDAMVNLFRTMMWRHSKADVEDEVVLPPLQERAVVVPMDVAERKWAPPLPRRVATLILPAHTPQVPSTASATTRCTPTSSRRSKRSASALPTPTAVPSRSSSRRPTPRSCGLGRC